MVSWARVPNVGEWSRVRLLDDYSSDSAPNPVITLEFFLFGVGDARRVVQRVTRAAALLGDIEADLRASHRSMM